MNMHNNEIYNVLLKDVEQKSFGVSNIIPLIKKGKVMSTVKKLVVTYNGEKYDPVDCQSITVKVEGDVVILDVVLTKDEKQPIEDAPQVDTVVSSDESAIYALQGDDLEAFELLSDFRREENQGEKTETSELKAYTLESATFDIQDLQSVQNSILDVLEKEKQLISQGYKIFKYNIPRFDYEDNDHFKLVESAILIKIIDKPIEETNKTVT